MHATAGGTIPLDRRLHEILEDKAIQSSAQANHGVQFSPFLTSPPDFTNTPPVTRMIGPGLTQLYASPDHQIPDFLLDQGTKYIVRWTAEDDDAIVSQRIDFSPDGHFPDRFSTLVSDIPASARSWEITIPNPGFAGSNEPQFLKVVTADANGQEGFDEAPVLVPSGNITGTLTITTDLSGQTFTAGEPHSRHRLDRVCKCRNDHAGDGFRI